jgi:hypothetical protein
MKYIIITERIILPNHKHHNHHISKQYRQQFPQNIVSEASQLSASVSLYVQVQTGKELGHEDQISLQ